jgi:hypothetical protein
MLSLWQFLNSGIWHSRLPRKPEGILDSGGSHSCASAHAATFHFNCPPAILLPAC